MVIEDLLILEIENMKNETLSGLKKNSELYPLANKILTKNSFYFEKNEANLYSMGLISDFLTGTKYEPRFLSKKDYDDIMKHYVEEKRNFESDLYEKQ